MSKKIINMFFVTLITFKMQANNITVVSHLLSRFSPPYDFFTFQNKIEIQSIWHGDPDQIAILDVQKLIRRLKQKTYKKHGESSKTAAST